MNSIIKSKVDYCIWMKWLDNCAWKVCCRGKEGVKNRQNQNKKIKFPKNWIFHFLKKFLIFNNLSSFVHSKLNILFVFNNIFFYFDSLIFCRMKARRFVWSCFFISLCFVVSLPKRCCSLSLTVSESFSFYIENL